MIPGLPILVVTLGGAVAPASGQILFTEVGIELGLSGDTYDTANGHGLGMSWLDVDVDGDVDLFAVNGKGLLPHLFLNGGDGTFTEAPELLPALPDVELMGSVFADYDRDGDPDLYIFTDNETRLPFDGNPQDGPPNLLLKNLWAESGGVVPPGGPLFEEVAAAAGVDDLAAPPFGSYPAYRSTSGGWLDYDRDGWVDLFVGHWATQNGGSPANENRLYRNNGDGTFTDVTVAAGLSSGGDPALLRPLLAFVAAHLDDDLWPDLYLANVEDPPPYHYDQHFRNNGDGTFTDVTASSPGLGDDSEAAMGVTVADLDLDGDWDLYLSDIYDTFLDEPPLGNPLYLGAGDGTFSDNVAVEAGVAGDSSWGVKFFDADLDGWEDLFVGTIGGSRPNLLFANNGDGTFTDVGVAAGVSDTGDVRGAAVADYDRDGDLDLAMVHDPGRLRLFRNDTPATGHWLEVELRGRWSNLDAIGAVVKATAGGVTRMRQVIAGDSIHSQSELTLHFGLGDSDTVDSLEVRWPSGAVNVHSGVAADRLLVVEERLVGTLGLWTPGIDLFRFRHSNTSGPPDAEADVTVGAGDWRPIAGDWDGDGLATPGLIDPATGEVALWNDLDGGAADISFFLPTTGDWVPVAGDWDGDGLDGVGLGSESVARFELWNGLAGGPADLAFPVPDLMPGWIPIAGDWNGDGVATVGRYWPSAARFALTDTVGIADAETLFPFGVADPSMSPVVGDWDGDGAATVGVYRPALGRFYLRNENDRGPTDVMIRFGPRGAGSMPIAGSWVLPVP